MQSSGRNGGIKTESPVELVEEMMANASPGGSTMRSAKIFGLPGILALVIAALSFFAAKTSTAQVRKHVNCAEVCMSDLDNCGNSSASDFQSCRESCSPIDAICAEDCNDTLSTAVKGCGSTFSACVMACRHPSPAS